MIVQNNNLYAWYVAQSQTDLKVYEHIAAFRRLS